MSDIPQADLDMVYNFVRSHGKKGTTSEEIARQFTEREVIIAGYLTGHGKLFCVGGGAGKPYEISAFDPNEQK